MKKQILTIKKFFLFLTLSALVSPLLLADQREENINLFLVLDKSLSMAEEIGEVKRYVNDFLFDAFLIPGDRVAIIPFYGKTELLFSGIVEDYNAKDPLRKMVEAMTADGRYTDIGNALDRLKLTLEEEPPRELHNYLLLITDGIQEAPPESPYYSSDGSFNHRFLENTKTIRKQGWKIQILGIGQKSAAKDVAEELSGAYAEISDDEITAEKIDEAASQIYGMIRPLSEPVLSPADASGAAYFTMNLESTGYTTDKTVKIYGVRFETAEGGSHQVLDISRGSFFSITLSPNEEKTLALPLSLSEIPESEPLKGSLALNFSSEVPITPAVFSVTLEKSPPGIFWQFLSSRFLMISVAAAGLIVLILLGLRFLRGRRGSSRPSNILSCVVDGALQSKWDVSLSSGEHFFLKRDSFGITFDRENVKDALAKITRAEKGTFFELLPNKELKPRSSLDGNIIDRMLNFRTKDNQWVTIQIRNKK